MGSSVNCAHGRLPEDQLLSLQRSTISASQSPRSSQSSTPTNARNSASSTRTRRSAPPISLSESPPSRQRLKSEKRSCCVGGLELRGLGRLAGFVIRPFFRHGARFIWLS